MNRAYSLDWSPNTLSPTTTKLTLQKNVKKIEQLKEELRSEFSEKNELIEENNGLKKQISLLEKQTHMKFQECERLKEDVELLQLQLEGIQRISVDSNKTSTESLHLKQDLISLQTEKQLLENENENIKVILEKTEEKIKFLTTELTSIEQLQEELEVSCYNKDIEINEWQRKCEHYKMEICDLNEYNRTLNERIIQLESKKEVNMSLPLENTESLDREFKFQRMQEQIDEMEVNLRNVEEEQSKLIVENDKLIKEKINSETLLMKLKSEKVEVENQSVEMNEKLTILLEENLTLNEENRNLKSKVREAEKMIDNCSRKFNSAIEECNESRKKLQLEKEDLDSNILSLSQELHSTTRQLEDAIDENKNYEIMLQDTRTVLQDKIAALLVMTSHCSEVEKTRENLKTLLHDTDNELKLVETTKNALQKELFSARTFIEQTLEENMHKCALLEQKIENDANELNILQSLQRKITTENNELQTRVAELSIIKERYSQIQEDIKELKTENEKLLNSNKEKLQLLKELEKHVQIMTDEMEKLKHLNEGLGNTNDIFAKQIQDYCENECRLKNENTILDQAVRELKSEEKRLSHELQEISSQKESLCSQVESLEQKLELKETEEKELQKLVMFKSDDIKVLKKTETELFNEIENLRGQNKKLRCEVDKLISHVELFNNEKTMEFKKMKEECDEKVNEKILELESVRLLVEEKESKINALLELECLMKTENERLAENLKQIEGENVEAQYRIEELLKEKDELHRMEKINKDAFQNQLQIISSENEQLHHLLKSLQVDNDIVKQKIGETEEKIRNVSQVHDNEIEKIITQKNEVQSKLDCLILDKQKREEQLLSQLEILNVKLVEESQRGNILQRTHISQLQKQIEINRSLENKLQHYENSEKDVYSKRINELKAKLEEALESNERFAEELKTRLNDNKILIKENENLLVKIDDLETVKTDLQDACDRLLSEKDNFRKEQEVLSYKVDNMTELLRSKEEDIDRLKDEYEIFKDEYRKLVQHKDELENEFKDTLLQENDKLNRKYDELTQTNSKLGNQLFEKGQTIKTLTMKIKDLEMKMDVNNTKESRLNETHVIASGPENESYISLRQENLKMVQERDSYKQKLLELEVELEKEKDNYRTKAQKLYEKIGSKLVIEYEGKLQRAKTEYQRKLSEKYESREKELKKKEEEYKMMLDKEKEHNKDLNSQNWNIMDQYLLLKQAYDRRCSDIFQDNFLSPSTLRKTRSATHLNMLGSCRSLTLESDRRISTISSRGSLVPESDRCLSTMSTISEDFLMPVKKKPSTISAKVFPTEDEEQEIFDNACLADLKQGRMANEDSLDFSKQRLSILQARNSLCPPHLKSSYPAETQFIPPQEFKENEIKMGHTLNDISDTENLLPGDRQRKSRNQTSYKKPGPPTPSKNGGRSSVQVETPKKALKDSNDNGNPRRKSFTPKFLNNLFTLRGQVNIPSSTQQNDENIPLTPKHTRLSSIRRKFSRNTQELGNNYSGYV